MKNYTAPQLTVYGDVAELTATLGDPFTGDTSFDLDGNPIESDGFSVNQCPTTDNDLCVPDVP